MAANLFLIPEQMRLPTLSSSKCAFVISNLICRRGKQSKIMISSTRHQLFFAYHPAQTRLSVRILDVESAPFFPWRFMYNSKNKKKVLEWTGERDNSRLRPHLVAIRWDVNRGQSNSARSHFPRIVLPQNRRIRLAVMLEMSLRRRRLRLMCDITHTKWRQKRGKRTMITQRTHREIAAGGGRYTSAFLYCLL